MAGAVLQWTSREKTWSDRARYNALNPHLQGSLRRRGDAMSETHGAYEDQLHYDAESDVLEVHFSERRRAWTIELTDNILISIDREQGAVLGLTFLDFRELIRPTPFGPRSFPVTGLADLPIPERDLVLSLVNAPPVNRWLDVSAVQSLPDSPFAVAHLEPPPKRVLELLPAVA